MNNLRLLFLSIFIFSQNKFSLSSNTDLSNSKNFSEQKLFEPEDFNLENKKTKAILASLLREVVTNQKDDPYIHVKAEVRRSKKLSKLENNFLKKRDKFTLRALEKFLDKQINPTVVPRIAFCLSGGGYRSMIGSIGALVCAKNEGLLDAITYISCLSGSTWIIGPWTTSDFSLNNLEAIFRRRISESLNVIFGTDSLIKSCFWKLLYRQPLSFVDVWALILAKKLFYFRTCQKEDKFVPRLSESVKFVEENNLPLPIYTALMVNENRDWIEFTPYEIGSYQAQIFIPTWAYGRTFYSGYSTDNSPECGLDYYLALCSSAFAANLEDILRIYGGSSSDNVLKILKYTYLSKFRFSPAKIFNFAYGVKNHPWQFYKYQILVDAGIDFNLPLPPLLRPERKVDIIIILDMSATIEKAQELRQAENYALKNELRFPKIDYENIDKNVISVFKDEFPEKPIIIYLPRIKNNKYSQNFDPCEIIKNRGYCSTFNFKYTQEQFDELSGLTKFNLKENLSTIKNVILYAIAKNESRDRAILRAIRGKEKTNTFFT